MKLQVGKTYQTTNGLSTFSIISNQGFRDAPFIARQNRENNLVHDPRLITAFKVSGESHDGLFQLEEIAPKLNIKMLSDIFTHAAMDKTGAWFLYVGEPELTRGEWQSVDNPLLTTRIPEDKAPKFAGTPAESLIKL